MFRSLTASGESLQSLPSRAAVHTLENRNEETFGVPLDQRPGMFVPIPCRHCGKSFIRFALEAGERTVVCARCGGVTEVRVTAEGETLRVRTGRGAVRAKSAN